MMALVPSTDSKHVLFPLEIAAVMVHLIGENSGLSLQELTHKVNVWGLFTALAERVFDAREAGFEWTRENIAIMAVGLDEERNALTATMPNVLRPVDSLLTSLFITF